MTMQQLSRVRHGARAALALGVVVSIVANILHAAGNVISQAIAAWAPIALLITIELIARVPVRRGWLSAARLLATTTIAGIAAWVSYWHMAGVALRYGEEQGAAHLIPLTVDGLVVVAWVCLVEVAGRIRELPSPVEVAHQEIDAPAPPPAKAPVFLAPVSAPPALPEQPTSGAPVGDEPAGQKVRQDSRTTQQMEDAVRAVRRADPSLSQRRIADLTLVPLTTVRRILQQDKAVEAAQPEELNGRVPDLQDASV